MQGAGGGGIGQSQRGRVGIFGQGREFRNGSLDARVRGDGLGVILALSEPEAQGVDVGLQDGLEAGGQFSAGGFFDAAANPQADEAEDHSPQQRSGPQVLREHQRRPRHEPGEGGRAGTCSVSGHRLRLVSAGAVVNGDHAAGYFPLYTGPQSDLDQRSETNMKRLIQLFLSVVCAADALAAESKIIAPGATLQKLAGGFLFTEGPACDGGGNVFFTDQPNDRILKWSIDGQALDVHAAVRARQRPLFRSRGVSLGVRR